MIKHGFMLVLCLILINDIYTDKLVPTEQHKVQVFCFLDKVVGNCNDTVTRWYFDKVDAKCKQFVYSGCGANENNFENEHGCRDRCQNSAIGNKSVEAGGSCLQTRRSIVEKGVAPGTFVPNCQSDGTFSARQCLGSTSECWCVDPQTGREIDRTRTGPGQENVFCNEGSKKCPVESPLKDESGKEIFCGTGSNHRDCPQGYTCSEHPTGAYAVCCKNAVLPTVEPKIVRRPNGEHGLLTDSSEKLGVNHAEVIEDRMRGGARRIEQPENDTSIDEFPATNQSLSLPVGACAKAEKTPNFTPRCTSEGYFEWVQCDNQQNCWCVQPDTGEEMEGTRKNGHVLCLDCIASGPMLSTFRPACDISFAAPMRMYKTCPPFAKTCGCLDFRTGKEIEQLTVKSGETTPQCDFMPTFRGGCNASEVHDIGQQQCSINGFYSPFQCDFKNGYSCYCVDPENQNEIPNTRLRGDENREQQYNPCPKCIMSKLVALDYLAFGSFVPQCTKEKGFFNPLQCNNRTGVCFCVYSDGTVVPGTRRNISAGLPDCKETNRSIANNQFNRSSIEDSAETVSFNPIHSPQNLETVNIPGNDGVMSHGRCEVGTGVKCTEEGFYDWVQCDGRQDGYCWCVHPETGVELEGSRKSGKILCTDCLGLAPLVLNNAPKCDIASHNVKANATVCPPFAKMCGCFDAASGSMLPGRESVPGQPMPNCEFLPTVRGQCNVSTLTKDSCTKNGFFVPIQCNNNTECWCVDPESGKEISGSRVSGRALPPKCSKCHFARALALDYFPFAFLPQCSETGDFFPAQCDSKTSTCFCVDRNGVITPGSRISATPSNPPECRADSGASIAVTNIESSIDQESPCTKLVKTAQENRFVGSFVPKCTPTGAFAPLQCHGSTGQCWCVHENGTEVNGTRILPGEQQPNCVRTETSNTTSSAQPSSVGVRNSRVGGSQDNERIGTDNDRPVGPCTSVKNTLLPGAFVPKCTAWGDYEPEQCHGSTGQCWCVDLNGTEIANSRILPGQRRTDCKFHGSIRNSNESSIDARHSRLGASLENDKNLTEDGRSAGPCATQLKSIKDPTLPGAFVPKCTAWGDYEPEQCHGSLGQCWCVDLNGTEIAGSRVLPGHGRTNCKFQESPQGPPRSNVLSTASASVSCQNILEKLQKTDNPPGTFVPNCTANGGYEPMQCSSSSGQCWCVFSDGTEVPGTRGRPGEKVGGCHTTGDESTEPSSCQKVFEAVRNAPPGTFIPKCTLSGDYESLQCHGSTGQCWCVQRNGVEIAGTRGQPGQNVTCPTLRSLIESFGVVSSCQSAFDSVRNAPPGTFIPKCTVAGDYEPTQCHGSTGQCWCVTKNGTEIIGTRGQPGQNVTCQSQGGETVSTEKPPSCRIVLEKVQNAPLPGAFVPKCTVSGEYERTQCHGSTGQCFCVTSDGTEIPGTRGQPGENITCQSQENGSTSCRTALEKIGSAPPPGTFIPKCTVLGDYEPTQCHGSTGQCFCVSSDGTEIPGTRVQPGQNVTCTSSRTGSSATESSSCRQVLERVGNAPPGTYIPQCTISGGYEQTQCHGSTGQCWCVTETGSEISGTRVQPGQKATCKSQGQSSTDTGPCRRVLQSMGSEPPPPGRFVPQCTALGDYEPKQCHGSTGQCWCVTKNGTEIEGSRVQPGQNTICKQDVVSIQPSIEQPPLVVPQQGLGSSVICVKAKDRGSCIDNNNQSSVARWYYNGDKSSCLVFKYSGCAGNENNFKSKTECEMRCKPQDGPTCNGNSAAPIFATTAGSVNESANTNANVSLNGTFRRNPTCVNVQCPVGFKCRSGWIAPSCCNASIEEVFEDAYSKTCKNGRKAYAQKFDYKDYVQAYFGDSCDDLPCPTGFECQQTSSMFAKCCATSDIAEIGDTEPSSRPTSSCPYGPALTNKETGGTFACNPRKSCPAESFCSSNSTQDPSDSSYREGICCIEQKVPTALKRVFAKENCSADIRDKIDICLQPFSNLTQRIYKFVSFSAGNVDQLLPQNGSIESLNEACSKYSDYHTCTSTLLKPYCYSHSNALVEEILGFACQPQSITTLTNNRKCLESASSDPAVQFCVTQFSQTLRLLNDGSSASFGALCSSVERFVDCSSLPIAKNCSADLAPLLKQLVNRTITAMFGATCEDVVREEQKELSLNVFTDVGCTKDQSEALRFCTKKLVASPIISSKLVQPYNGASLLATNEQLALLDDFCAQYKEFEICTQPVSLTNDKCKPFLYKALVDVVGFNCRNENVQLWKQYGFCLSKLVNRTDVRPCFDKLERMQENFNSTEFGVDTPIRSLCDQTEEYIECMRQPITDQCGKNAFDFHKAVFSNAKKTLFTPCFQLQNGKLENVDAANTQQIIIDIGTGHQTAETVPLAFTPTFQPELGVVTTTLQPGFQPVFTSASPDNVDPTDSSQKSCALKRDSMLWANTVPSGQYIPQCKDNGNYAPTQCDAAKGTCWCVNELTGEEISGTLVHSSENKTPSCGTCHKERSATTASSSFVPMCQDNGKYQPLQCSIESGYCWCVDVETGAEVNGSKVGPGKKLPTCGVSEVYACGRLPFKMQCLPDGSKPQEVFRWYRDGSKCKMYRFSYCVAESHVPPYPLKEQKDCEELCIGRQLDFVPVKN